MNQILECVPNFSEGRDLAVIEKLCDCFRGKPGVRLLDYTWDQDHNRCVLTIIAGAAAGRHGGSHRSGGGAH